MKIDFTNWTKATGDLLPGQQRVFLDMLKSVAEDDVHLVHGADYRDGKPCLVNGVATMLSTTAVSPSGMFPAVVGAFDEVCSFMELAGLNKGMKGYVSPLMAETLIRNFGELKPMVVAEPTVEAATPVPGVYIEPSDLEMQQALDAMRAPAPDMVHEDDYARSFVEISQDARDNSRS